MSFSQLRRDDNEMGSLGRGEKKRERYQLRL